MFLPMTITIPFEFKYLFLTPMQVYINTYSEKGSLNPILGIKLKE